ncbi:hypothetical protein [Sorangium sp. So ce341]|uniref:hypothetical protein n=1 Tax=Sorangium sp. So ce341 TaxID=3133302 RepID=UPI003F638271
MAPRRTGRRFEGHPTYQAEARPGGAVALYEPRFAAARRAALTHRVDPGDRLDLLAHRYLGDAQKTHVLVDLNPTLDPESILEPGRRIAVGEE